MDHLTKFLLAAVAFTVGAFFVFQISSRSYDPDTSALAGAVEPTLSVALAASSPTDVFADIPREDAASVQPGFEMLPQLTDENVLDVTFDLPENFAGMMSSRELRDQYRDWLMFALIALDADDSADLGKLAFELAPVRDGTLRDAYRWSFGETRFVVRNDKTVLALIPAEATDDRRKDLVAEIADDAASWIGSSVSSIHLYIYELNEEDDTATLKASDLISGEAAYSTEYGYHTAKISVRDELEHFLTLVDDVTHLSVSGNSFELSGRRILARDYRGVTMEHVAELWKAEQWIERAEARIEKELSGYKDIIEKRLNSNTRFSNTYGGSSDRTFSPYTELQRKLLEREGLDLSSLGSQLVTYDTLLTKIDRANRYYDRDYFRPVGSTLSQSDAQRMFDSLGEIVFAEALASGDYVQGIGFSLDPAWDLSKVAADSRLLLNKRTTAASNAEQWKNYVTEYCLSGDGDTEFHEALRLLQAIVQADEPEPLRQDVLTSVSAAIDGLNSPGAAAGPLQQGRRLGALYQALDYLEGDLLNEGIQCAIQSHSFQAARYDGPLQGTKSGMNLFYTDLLAKLWVIRYEGATPHQTIDDFVNLYTKPVDVIFEAESVALNGARLWFGLDDEGVRRTESGDLYFPRVSTRIYGAGSDPANPGAEEQTGRSLGTPLVWWNDHYAEVAEFEQEYERLNQIIKWTAITSELHSHKRLNRLSFLENDRTSNTRRFPTWAREQGDRLRYTDWDSIPFYSGAQQPLSVSTEALPLLVSLGETTFEPRETRSFSGGVSGADRYAIQAVKPVSRSSPVSSRRPGFDALSYSDSAVVNRAGTRSVSFGDNGRTARVTPKRAGTGDAAIVRRQGIGSELANDAVNISFGKSPLEAVHRVANDQVPFGDLIVRHQNGRLSIGFEARELDTVRAMAKRLSLSDSLAGLAAGRNEFDTVVSTGETAVFARMAGSKKWHQFEFDAVADWRLKSGFDGRASARGAPRGVLFKVGSSPNAVLRGAETLSYSARNSEALAIRTSTSVGSTGRPVTLSFGGVDVPVRVTADGQVIVKASDLPAAIRESSESLLTLLERPDIERVVSAVRSSPNNGTIRVDLPLRYEGESIAFLNGVAREAPNTALSRHSRLERASLDAYRARKLREIDDAISEGFFAQADNLTTALAREIGETVDIKLRRAANQLANGRPRQAAEALNDIGAGKLNVPLRVREEIDIMPLEHLAVHRSSFPADRSIQLVPNEQSLALRKTLEPSVLDSAEAVTVREVAEHAARDASSVRIYGEASQGLAALDVSVNGFETSLSALVGDARIVRVKLGGAYSPSEIAVQSQPQTYVPTGTAPFSARQVQLPRPAVARGAAQCSFGDEPDACLVSEGEDPGTKWNVPTPSAGCLNGDDTDVCDEALETVYIILAKAA